MTQTATTTSTPRHDLAPAWLQIIGGRKFVLAAVVILVASIGLFLALIDGQQWLAAVGIAVGSYSASNAATHWSQRPEMTPLVSAAEVEGIHIDPNAG